MFKWLTAQLLHSCLAARRTTAEMNVGVLLFSSFVTSISFIYPQHSPDSHPNGSQPMVLPRAFNPLVIHLAPGGADTQTNRTVMHLRAGRAEHLLQLTWSGDGDELGACMLIPRHKEALGCSTQPKCRECPLPSPPTNYCSRHLDSVTAGIFATVSGVFLFLF